MASRLKKPMGKRSKSVEKPAPSSGMLKLLIRSGQAMAAPPIGPQVSRYGIAVQPFCKDFNERTKKHVEGMPLPTRVFVDTENKSYEMSISAPTSMYLLRAAAGVQGDWPKPQPDSPAKLGLLSFKHIYEIAKVKGTDFQLEDLSMELKCSMLINTCKWLGIRVVPRVSEAEMAEFQKLRGEYLEEEVRREEMKTAADKADKTARAKAALSDLAGRKTSAKS